MTEPLHPRRRFIGRATHDEHYIAVSVINRIQVGKPFSVDVFASVLQLPEGQELLWTTYDVVRAEIDEHTTVEALASKSIELLPNHAVPMRPRGTTRFTATAAAPGEYPILAEIRNGKGDIQTATVKVQVVEEPVS